MVSLEEKVLLVMHIEEGSEFLSCLSLSPIPLLLFYLNSLSNWSSLCMGSVK